MKIVYLGPSEKVEVYPYGEHAKGQEKEYPDDFAADLLTTSKKQHFEIVKPVEDENSEAVPVVAKTRSKKGVKKD